MSFSSEDIQKIGRLARLQVEEDKAASLSQDLNNILGLMNQLQEANTDGIEPMANPLDASQVLRADTVTAENQREHLQKVAPATEDGLYLVPKVID